MRTIRPASGPSTRIDVVIPSAVAGMINPEIFCLLLFVSLTKPSTISKPRQADARKKTRNGGSLGLIKACPHRSGCQENSAAAASAADGLIQRAHKRYRKYTPSWKKRKLIRCQAEAGSRPKASSK